MSDTKTPALTTPLRVGDILYGYCGGMFGRDSYDDKRVEAIGSDWVVLREDGKPLMYEGSPEDMLQYRTPPPEGDRW